MKKKTIIMMLGLAAGVVLLGGCKKQETLQSETPQTETNEEQSESEEWDYEDKEYTFEEIVAMEDFSDLIVELCWYITKKADYGDALERLTEQEKVLFFCSQLEAEVYNGGFDQFFFNSSGDYCYETVEALKTIGAESTLEMLERAMAVYSDPLAADCDERTEYMEENQTDEMYEKLCELDEEFYSCEEDRTELLYEYYMDNQENFHP